jgi:hypothetical protein
LATSSEQDERRLQGLRPRRLAIRERGSYLQVRLTGLVLQADFSRRARAPFLFGIYKAKGNKVFLAHIVIYLA